MPFISDEIKGIFTVVDLKKKEARERSAPYGGLPHDDQVGDDE